MEYPALIRPTPGKIYHNRNGRTYRCTGVFTSGAAIMERVSDGWTFTAHGLIQYQDGAIEWDFSTDSHWNEKGGRND